MILTIAKNSAPKNMAKWPAKVKKVSTKNNTLYTGFFEKITNKADIIDTADNKINKRLFIVNFK